MTQITLDSSQVQQLADGPTLVECRDESGKLVGVLHTVGPSDKSKIPDFTLEQLEQFRNEPGGRPLSEILADLRKRR